VQLSRAEAWIAITLRSGVLLSLALIALGTAVTFTHHPQYISAAEELDKLTQPGAAFPTSLAEVVDGLSEGQGRAIVVTGLLILIATPVLRVAISVLVFLEERDRTFAFVTGTVLVILLLSFALGKAG
jgi:uncharacterized membrane protein